MKTQRKIQPHAVPAEPPPVLDSSRTTEQTDLPVLRRSTRTVKAPDRLNLIQDIAILFNLVIILLMLFNTYVFQVGLVSLLLGRFRVLLLLSAIYLTLSISFHSWTMNLRWLKSNHYVWTDGLQALFVLQRIASVLYYYFYKRTTEYLGDPRLYEDSPWLRDAFANARARQ
ncbi:hypothetical protein UPYG_G00080600 [Umbra pygmaea]|uniref:Transmembrane protein 138 n=1 Tax=Umbra pygmaea TaxID=75934 RepID=A0ABD0XE18_UMBPY